VRQLPLPALLEIAVFVLLVFLGLGTRPWHLLHSFVPLVFVCLFVGERVAAVVSAGILVALWALYGLFVAWPAAPLEPSLSATVPTIIVIGTTLLVVFVRRLLDDIDAILDIQRTAARAIARARRMLALQQATSAVYGQVSERLVVIAERLSSSAETLQGTLEGAGPTAAALSE
jgi:hypothetical protein